MLSSGKRSLSKEDIRAADKDEKVSNASTRWQRATSPEPRRHLAGNLNPYLLLVAQESLLEHDSDLDEEMLFT